MMTRMKSRKDAIPQERKRRNSAGLNVLTILLVVVLVVLVGVYAVINHYYSKSNYVSDDKSRSINPQRLRQKVPG